MSTQTPTSPTFDLSRRDFAKLGVGTGAAGLLAWALSGCSTGASGAGTTAGASGPLKMTFLDVVKQYVESALAEYKKRSGVATDLGLVPGGWADLATRLNAERQAGKAPDFSLLGVGFIGGMAARGQLNDLAPLVRDAGVDLSPLTPSSLERWKDGEKLWALPAAVFTQAMYYNKTLFDKAGIEQPSSDWTKPWSFDQWREAAKKLNDGKEVFGTYANLTPERTCQYLWSNGASVFSEDGSTFEMASPEAIETYEFLAAFEKDGLAPSQDLVVNTGADVLFGGGRIGMLLEGSWMLGSVVKMGGKFEIGVAPAPAGSTGVSSTPVWNDSWIIPQGSKNPERAIDVLKFMVSEDGLAILSGPNGMNGLSPISAMNKSNIDKLFDGLLPERKQVWVDSLDHSRNYYFAPNYAEILNAFDQELALIPSGDKTPAEALKALREQVQPLLDAEA